MACSEGGEKDPGETRVARCWSTADRTLRMSIATLLHGVGTGVIGIMVAVLIKSVQFLGFCFGSGAGEDTGFLDLADHAGEWRRAISVSLAGVFSAVAWYWLRGHSPAFVPVEECMKGATMPPAVTLMNGAIQDIAVALGGSFGREAAPREIAAMWGCVLADKFQVTPAQRKVLVACGTGAGLAAVYSVPISGTLYTIEHILNWDLSPGALIPAIITACIATSVSSKVVETEGLYTMKKRYSKEWPSQELLLWAFVMGPICGIAASLFTKLITFARTFRPHGRFHLSFEEVSAGQELHILWNLDDHEKTLQKGVVVSKTAVDINICFDADLSTQYLSREDFDSAHPQGQRNWHILIFMPAAFLLLAVLSRACPSLLGNGRALAEVSIHQAKHHRSVGKLVVMLLCKILVTAAAIASGVDGGTLTPSVAIGATLGAVIGAGCADTWRTKSLETEQEAVIASVAFLAPAMRSPVTALFLILEFTAQGVYQEELELFLHGNATPLLQSKLAAGMLIPMTIAVVGAMLIFNWLMRKDEPKPTLTTPVRVDTLAALPEIPPRYPLQRQNSDSGASDLDLGLEVVILRKSHYVEEMQLPVSALGSRFSSRLTTDFDDRKLLDTEEGLSSDLSPTTPIIPQRPTIDQGTQTPGNTCSGSCLVGLPLLFGRARRVQ